MKLRLVVYIVCCLLVCNISAQSYLDPNFGVDGEVLIETTESEFPARGVLVGDSVFVLVTNARESPVLYFFNLDGTLNTNLGYNGVVHFDALGIAMRANDLAVDQSGNILVCGGSGPAGNNASKLVKVTFGGALVSSFADQGVLRTEKETANQTLFTSISLLPDGGYLLGNYSSGNSYEVHRYDSNGNPVNSFGESGIIQAPLLGALWMAQVVGNRVICSSSIAVDADAQSLLRAYKLSDGSLDASWSGNGMDTVNIAARTESGPIPKDALRGIHLTSDGGILFYGGHPNGYGLYKTDANGNPDVSFGDQGLVKGPPSLILVERFMMSETEEGQLVFMDQGISPDGRIEGNNLYQINADGSPDYTFSDTGFVYIQTPSEPSSDVAFTQNLLPDGSLLYTAFFSFSGSNQKYIGLLKTVPLNQISTGVDDLTSNSGMATIYPNPVNNQLCLKNLETPLEQFRVTDLVGRESFLSKQGSHCLNTSDLAAGSYILHVETQRGTVAIKFVKE